MADNTFLRSPNLSNPGLPLMLRCVLISLFVVSTSPLAAADWRQWRGAHRDGVATDSPPLINRFPDSGLTPVWLSEEHVPSARSGGWSSPVVANGRVIIFTHQRSKVATEELPPARFPYLAPNKRTGMTAEEYEEYEQNRRDEQEQRSRNYRFDEVVYAFDAGTGKTVWKNEQVSVYTRFPQSGSPAVVDGRIYLLAAGRQARCLDEKTGTNLWQTKLPGEFRDEFLQSSFVVVDGVAVVLANRVFGLDALTGKVLWASEEETGGNHTSPVVWNSGKRNHVLVNLRDDTCCLDAASGKELWRVRSEGGQATPIVFGDLLITYGNSRKKGLRCFQLAEDGAEHRWTYQGTGDPGGSPVLVDGHVYVQGEKRLACVDIASGKARWLTTLDVERPRYSSLIAADGKIFYSFDSVLCFAADPEEFTQLVNAKIDADGLLADEQVFRKVLNIDELEKTSEGQKAAEKLWRQKFGHSGPLSCCTPAIVDGRMFLRLQDRVACYDLRIN